MREAAAVADERRADAAPRPRPARAPSRWLPPGILLAAALLSFPRLGSRTLWLDEAYTVGATNQLFDTWRNTAGTQALYYLLVWPSTRVSTDPVWLRLPSALIGLAALVVVLRIGRRIGGPRVGLLAAGGLALSWGFARYAIEARSYTLALLIVSVGWLALIAAVQTGAAADADADSGPDGADADAGADAGAGGAVSRRWWRVFYAATLLAPLAHGLAALNLVAQLAALAIAPGDRRGLLRRAVVVVPVLAVEVAVLFLLGAAEVGGWVPPLSWGQVRGAKQLLTGYELTGAVLTVLVAVAVASAVRRFLRERSRDAWIQLLPAFWAFGPALIVLVMSLVRPYMAARYLFPSLPGIFLLLAGLLVRLGAAKRIAVASLLVGGLLLVDHRYVTTVGLENWSGLTSCIAANVAEGDRLLTGEAHRSAVDYYWSRHPELAGVEPLDPSDPLGRVRRIYDSRIDTRPQLRGAILEDTSASIWYVERGSGGLMSIAGLAFDEQVIAHFDVLETMHFEGGLSLVRLDPVDGGPPRAEAPCDTVEPAED